MCKSPTNTVSEATTLKQKASNSGEPEHSFCHTFPSKEEQFQDRYADYEIEHSSQTIHYSKLPVFILTQ